jgi:hypothetical protein
VLGLVILRLRLPLRPFKLLHLGLGDADILLDQARRIDLRLGLLHLALRLVQAGGRLIDLLLRRCGARHGVLALVVGLGVDEITLGLLQRALGGKKIGGECRGRLFKVELAAGEFGLGLLQLGGGLVERRLVVARIDLDDHLALRQTLVVVDVEGHDLTRDARRDGDGAAFGEGVIGVDQVAGGEPIEEGADRGDDEDEQEDRANEDLAAAGLAFLLTLLFLVAPPFLGTALVLVLVGRRSGRKLLVAVGAALVAVLALGFGRLIGHEGSCTVEYGAS